MNHTGGHLPFSGDITELLHYGKSNLLVVAVNNTLNQNTIPQGTLHQPTDPKRLITFHFFSFRSKSYAISQEM